MLSVMPLEETALGRHADKLYNALLQCGTGWYGRADIAKQLGRPRLTSYDSAALDLLVETGRIEAERHDIPGPIPQRWEYRIK